MTTTAIWNIDRAIGDLKQIDMQPARDPLRSLVFHAAERAMHDVYVDGAQVMADGRDRSPDQADTAARLAEAQARLMTRVPQNDYLGRGADRITLFSLRLG